jgi:hypothetical protein
VVKESVWYSHTEKDKKNFDSTITIYFQNEFNDSVSVIFDFNNIQNSFIQTDKSTQLVLENFISSYSKLSHDKTVKIIFLKSGDSFSFCLIEEYSFVYISLIDKVYYIEYSNYYRNYY